MKEISPPPLKEVSPWRIQRYSEADDAEFAYGGAPGNPHLRDYWNILVKRRLLIAQVTFALIVTGAYFNFTATPVYKATATLKIEPATPTVTQVGELLRATEGSDYYQTQFRLLQSRALAARVIADLRLDSNKNFRNASITSDNPVSRVRSWFFGTLNSVISPLEKFFRQRKQPAPNSSNANVAKGAGSGSRKAPPAIEPWLIGHYMSFLQINPIRNTRLVDISFITPDPTLSQELADAHAQGFIRLNLESRFHLTKEAREFLDAKNHELKAKLERAERELNRFRQTHGVVSIEKGENIVVDRLVDLNRQLTAARTQRLEAESLNSVVQNKTTQYLSQVLTQGMIPTLRGNLVALETAKIRQSTVFKPDHPRIMELNQQIKEATLSLNAEINNVVRGIRENYVAARAKEEALEAESRRQQQAALNLKQVSIEYAVLQEEVNVNKNLYQTILRRLNETNVSNDIAVSNMQVIQSAEKSRGRFAPNVTLNLVTYAVLGVFFGSGLAFLLAYLDARVSTPDRVWRTVDLDTLGVVPDLDSINRSLLSLPAGLSAKVLPKRLQPAKSTSNDKDLIVSHHHPLSIFSEAYKTIRTALLLSQPEADRKVILLTSPSPGDGKTATTLNLGIALAQDGFKVLVIDADLRRGSCHARFGLGNQTGLSHLLAGKLSLEEVTQPTSVHGLSLLTRGVCPPNPSELLGGRKMKEALRSLRESFDFILIDSPPAIAVSDPTIISNVADAVILVFNAKKTTIASARQTKDRFDIIRSPVLGVILNGIDLKDPDYTYYRHYYKSHYYKSHYVVPEINSENGLAETETVKTDAPQINSQNGLTETETASIDAPRVSPSNEPTVTMESATVPGLFFDLVVSRLAQAMGPMAPVILDDHIAFLGEKRQSFPKSRLGELLKGISDEIPDADVKESFRQSIQIWFEQQTS